MATITEIAGTKQQKKILRTAAYCRVSSDSLDQLHSFAAQVQHYTKAISQNPSMELADIYADEGLTGTKTDKRDDFNRLIADCRKGKIDRVLTKSVSRFARNTVDSLMYARMLKEYGVSILFEKENIDTAYMSSELLLALSGAQAQEESISISKNMRWSVERRMKSGTYQLVLSVTYFVCFLMMRLQMPILVFGVACIAFCVVYSILACVLVYRLAPKTFRLRT